MARQRPPLRGIAAVVFGLAVFALLVVGPGTGFTDDIDLLRFTTAKPYVFFLVDTSGSMSLTPANKWVHANGDDPRSKIYQVKQILYDVFENVSDVQFGLATFNQDAPRAVAKHWLYYAPVGLAASAANWPLAYPTGDADGPVQFAADGSVTSDIEGDVLTFGKHFDATGIAGTCLLPLPFSTVIGSDDRERINRYSKLGASGNGPTQIWVKDGSKTYRLTVERPGSKPDASPNPKMGQDKMHVKYTLEEIQTCAPLNIKKTYGPQTVEMTLWTDFLVVDENVGSTASTGGKAGGIDYVAGFWDYKDLTDTAVCDSSNNSTGTGWEGNYDTAASGSYPRDPFCSGPDCYNLKRTTVPDPSYGNSLDRGDFLPFDWRVDNKAAFLERLAPMKTNGSPDFRIASYFEDVADANGTLPLIDGGNPPLFAIGPSGLGNSVNDFRCWYVGEGNKCNFSLYHPSWQEVAALNDSEWGCRKPYLIVISDGLDTCGGPNPCSDTANLHSKAGVQTWVIAYGADCTKAGNPLKCMAQNGKGLLLCPQNSTDLKTELQRILGLIRQEARSFASAAVPSVQAVVEDKIFLTNFTPLNGKSVWDGHVHSFLKPLPLRSTDSKPDLNHANHLWDAGSVMTSTQVNAASPTGSNANQRRVYYTRESTSADVPFGRRLFEKTVDPAATDTAAKETRYDLWSGLGVPFVKGNAASESSAQTTANSLIATTFAIKTATVDVTNPVTGAVTPTDIQYVLGDIFHSNPLVVGSPPSTQYYTLDLNGYRDFAAKHMLRRKMLLVGANDGMVHAFDAGLYNTGTDKFGNGTGKEVFGFIPRPVMPTVRVIAESTTTNHQWGVDGTLTVADAFIDPQNTGTPTVSQREWRTIAVGGLREGGYAYYALDLTQPDKLIPGDDLPQEQWVPNPDNGYVPSCLGEGTFDTAACGPVPFPSMLWEFDDSVVESGVRVALDEENLDANPNTQEGNNTPDLGETWSVPNIGRIRIAESTGSENTTDVYVAVFGGGLDSGNKSNPQMGTWIYIVDIETGKAIYKRQLDGAMPSEPAAVDSNGDGYLDRIYAATTNGYVYRIDMVADITSGSKKLFPALAPKSVLGFDDALHAVNRIPDTSWAVRKIFDANWDLATPLAVKRQIFFRPSVIFDAKLGAYILAFGAGDRDDLWNNDGRTGRFYAFADDSDKLPAGTVLTENNLDRVFVTDPAGNASLESQAVGSRGWYLVLDTNERVINDAFALAGVTFFSTFKPSVSISSSGDGPKCAKSGVSRIFIVSTLTADPFVQPPSGVTAPPTRQFTVPNFVTNPFAEQGQTKNASTGVDEICDDPTKMAIMESMKALFPPTCKFSNYRVDIKTISADTSLVCIAPVPVCLIEKNWKEY